MEFGFVPFSVADGVRRRNGKDGSSAYRLGVGESVGVLLDVDAQLLRKLAYRPVNPVSGVDVEPGDNADHQQRRNTEP